MMKLNSFLYGSRKYVKYTPKEYKNLLVTIVIIGFIIGFRDNRSVKGVDSYYIFFMLYSMIIVAAIILFKHLIQRLWMYKNGQNPEYRFSINSLLIGIVLVFATEGLLWFLPTGHTLPHHLQSERLGKWRYGLKYIEHARALGFGIIGLMVLALFLRFFESATTPLITHAINVIIAISIYSIIPLPENDGMYILYGVRWFWAFTLFLTIICSILLKLMSNPFLILIISVILSTILVIIYNINKQPIWFKTK